MARKRATNATDKKGWHRKALDTAARGSTVTECAVAAGVDRVTLYRHLESDEGFRQAFDDAIEQGTDVIEAAATRRAVEGTEEPVIYQGKVSFVGVDKDGNACDPLSPVAVKNVPLTVRKPSDVLAIFLLKGRKPKKFRDNIDVTSDGKSVALAPIRLDGDQQVDPLAERNAVPTNGNGHANHNGNGNGQH